MDSIYYIQVTDFTAVYPSGSQLYPWTQNSTLPWTVQTIKHLKIDFQEYFLLFFANINSSLYKI